MLKAYKPYNTKQPVDQEAYDQHIKDLEPSLKKFEELYIQDEGFLFGNGEISIADLPGKRVFADSFRASYFICYWGAQEFLEGCGNQTFSRGGALNNHNDGSRISLGGGLKGAGQPIIRSIFLEKCMKMKKNGVGVHQKLFYVDPPLNQMSQGQGESNLKRMFS